MTWEFYLFYWLGWLTVCLILIGLALLVFHWIYDKIFVSVASFRWGAWAWVFRKDETFKGIKSHLLEMPNGDKWRMTRIKEAGK